MRHPLTAVLLLCTFTACTAEPAATAPDTQPAKPQPQAPQTQPQTQPDVPQSQPDDGSAEAWLDRIEQAATDVKSLTADLRYDRNQLLLGDEQRRFGTLVYEAGPPPKFEVHFDRKMVDGHWTQPDLYYIYDGHWLLKRDHENKAAVRYQLVPDDAEAGRTGGTGGAMELGEGPFPIPLNLKKDRVLAKFQAKVIPATEDDPGNSVHLQLTPREDNDTDLTTVDLWFHRDSLLPVSVSTLDDSETQTIVRLTETKTNPQLPELSFDTSLPTEPGWQTDENRIQEDE
jgi:hypothetical protein